MTTTNDSSNGSADTPEKEPARATRGRTKRAAAGGIVKASPENGDVLVLADSTRVVETDTLPNHRPIGLDTFEIVGTLGPSHSIGRPIGANTFEIFTTDTLPGHRPVAVSTLHIADIHTLPGDRPIADNDDVDPHPSILMGYLD
ncbi:MULTISPECIES: hypothetical protein [Cyanophyceae]|uniref:Hedgehog/Intein (Hint) domain-containing protein n=1 Tax=Leptolyngbya subtilissima DQ-A4 TaxID=2933933 RepID=A0ABV0K113_9CYAN|nr:hypothetical protein [Nodosilinea sp. FACHB-141]MBD2111240.1 hypothetical protein [Nodosilinea sp. FACHB-141]